MTRGIEMDPGEAFNYGLRAYARLCMEDLDGAVEDCSAKIDLAPADSGAFALRAWAFFELGNFTGVAADIERAIEIDPSRRWYYYDCFRLVEAYRELGDYDKIIEFATSTIGPKLDRGLLVELVRRRARAYHLIGQDDKAIIDYTTAIGMASKSEMIELFAERSKVYEKLRLDDMSEKDRMTSLQLQAHRAQMSEWLPARPPQRIVAQVIDGFVVGCLSAFFLFVVANAIDIASGANASHAPFEMSQWQPLILATFGIGFLDALFVCFAPALAILSIPLIVAKLTTQPFSTSLLAAPLSNPELGFTLAVLVVVTINWMYHALMESSPKESTLGKSVFRLRVTDVDGARVSFRRSSIRHLMKVIPCSMMVVFFASIFFVTYSDIGVMFKAFVSLVSILLFVFSLMALANPGVHNNLSACIVSDNHLYTPRFNMITGPAEHDGT
ncbi:RDD family protein [Candidatus Obscuribacterales bacterium]|nr:RDD family protein [Candidatus Obscuribacterales bacterium]